MNAFIINESDMTTNHTKTEAARRISPEENRRNEALKVFKEYPGAISPAIQEKILAQQVMPGMAPNEAYLAAGAFTYKVEADSAKWGKDADPYRVMEAQTLHPDGSRIWMTFQTATQYPGEGVQRFQVSFEKGRAVEINKLARETGHHER